MNEPLNGRPGAFPLQRLASSSSLGTALSRGGLPTQEKGPMKSILDRSFDYTPAARTDLKKTFARIRREARARDAASEAASAEATAKVRTLKQAHK